MIDYEIDFRELRAFQEFFKNVLDDQNNTKFYSTINKGFARAIEPMLKEMRSEIASGHVHEGNLLEAIGTKSRKYGLIGGARYGYAPHLNLFSFGSSDRETSKGYNRGVMPSNDVFNRIINSFTNSNQLKAIDVVREALDTRIKREQSRFNR